MRNVAYQLQARMLALRDENTNILEVTQQEERGNWIASNTSYSSWMSQANESHNHQPLVIEHLRGQVASLKGVEHNSYAEVSYRDTELHAESQAYQIELSAEKMKSSHLHFGAKILKDAKMEEQKTSTIMAVEDILG